MTICELCEKPTTGSIGAAGLHWKNICQSCKDKEDNALLVKISRQKHLLDNVFTALVELKKPEVAK